MVPQLQRGLEYAPYGMVWYELIWDESQTDWPPRVRPKRVFAIWILCSAKRGSADWGLTPGVLDPDLPYGSSGMYSYSRLPSSPVAHAFSEGGARLPAHRS